MTLEELIQTPLMKDALILAGKSHLSRTIDWCLPSSAVDTYGDFRPGFLVLASASDGDNRIEWILDQVPGDYLAGVAFFKTYREEDSLSPTTISEFERRGVPLIELPPTTNTITFIRRFIAVHQSHLSDNFRNEDWLQEMCYREASRDDEALAMSFGFNPDFQYYCLIATLRSSETDALTVRDMESDSVRRFIQASLSLPDAPVLSFSSDQQVVAFFAWKEADRLQAMHEKVIRTVTDMRRAATSLKWTTVVGSCAESIGEFHLSYLNALRTLEIIEMLGVNSKVSFYDDWYMQMLLLKEPRAELREHMEHTLAPILDSPELLETLTNYLVYGENLKVTSEKMFIHVNTLKYRLKRIQKLLDVELSDPNTRFRLRMAITIERFLRN